MVKKSFVSMVLLLAMLVTSVGFVSADMPGPGSPWVSGFFVTNKSTTSTANVGMNFYSVATAQVAHTYSATVDPGDTKFFYLGTGGELEPVVAEGEFSVVLSSDEPIVAVVNSTSSGAGASTTSFDGISAPSAKLFAPNIYSNYYGYATNFYLQNAGSEATTVNIKYFDATGTEIVALAKNVNIPVGSFIKEDQAGVAAMPTNTVCSATFECTTANCQLAGIVNIVDVSSASYPGVGTANYVMFSEGSPVAYAPVVLNNYYRFNSSINVQNNGTGAVDVEIAFSDGTKITYGGMNAGATLGEGQAWSVYLPNISGLISGNDNGDLAAEVSIIDSVAGNAIVVLANTNNTNDASFASYNGVTSGAQTIYAPAANALAFAVAQGYFTSVTCQNLGTAATDLTYTWSGQNTKAGYVAVSGSGKMSDIAGAPLELLPGAAFVLLPNVAGHRTGLGNMPEGFNGAVVITASQDVSCVVNQNLLGGATNQDNLGSYTGRP